LGRTVADRVGAPSGDDALEQFRGLVSVIEGSDMLAKTGQANPLAHGGEEIETLKGMRLSVKAGGSAAGGVRDRQPFTWTNCANDRHGIVCFLALYAHGCTEPACHGVQMQAPQNPKTPGFIYLNQFWVS